MSESADTPRRSPLYPALIIFLICAVAGVAAWTAVSSPVMGLVNNPPTPTHASPFALAQIAKPTFTPLPTVTPSPTLEPTNSPEPMAAAEIVADTPTSEFAAPVVQNPYTDSAPAYSGNKYILVDISEQHMYVYEGDAIIYSFVASTGMGNATRVGNFSVLDKIPSAYGGNWNIWMPNWLGIYYAGSLENGIHALPILSNGATLWEGYLGTPISYGCVVLGTYESQLLYDWAVVGTPLEIQW